MSESEPIETHVLRPPREEEPRPVDQGAFRRQPPASPRLDCSAHGMIGPGSPHAAPTEGALRSVPPTVPGGGDEPRLFCLGWGERAPFFPSESPCPDERSDPDGSVGRTAER